MVKLTAHMFHVTIILAALLQPKNSAVGGPSRQYFLSTPHNTTQYFLSTPHNTTVTAGHQARLACSIGNLAGTCHWTRDGFALGTDRNLAGFSRYLVTGDREEVCDLSINPVLPSDEGEYQCHVSGRHGVGPGLGVGPISSAPVTLSVNSEPGQPHIVQAREEDMVESKEGEEVELECQSQGGRPPAEIQWWDGEGMRIVSDVTEHVKRMEDRKTFKTVSTLQFRPTAGQQVKCSAHNDAFPAGKMSQPLSIRLKGQPTVEVKNLEDGDSIKIFCDENEFANKKFKWFINDVEIFAENKNVLEIQQFSKSFDKSKVKCSVKDKNGEDEVVRIVKLVHKPKSSREQNVLPRTLKEIRSSKSSLNNDKKRASTNVNKRKTMFTCVVEEEVASEPKYVWIDGKLRNITPDEIVEASDQKTKYKCRVITKGMKKMKKMSKGMKILTKTLKKFSKTLTEITSLIDDT